MTNSAVLVNRGPAERTSRQAVPATLPHHDESGFESQATSTNVMAHAHADRRKASSSPKPMRIYDPHLAAVFASLPDPNSIRFPAVDMNRWLAERGLLLEPGGNLRPAYRFFQRTVDLVGSFVLLFCLAPLIAAVWITLWITTGGSPVFRQTRVGRCGRRFEILKFRTMRLDAEQHLAKVENEQLGPVFKNRRDPRITRVGYWLRRLSIDETLQLFNVLRGEMSLVGPRPPLPREVVLYEPWQFQRLAVNPGLTCLWQVSGRCDIDFDQWMLLDWWYVRNQSIWVDMKLLARTPLSVLSCRGAY